MSATTRKWWVLVGACLAGVMVALDFTIVNTSLTAIQSELQSSMQQLQWFVTGFGLTFCTFLTTSGRMADMFGRRKFLYIGLIVFGLASMGAGMSQTSWQLIMFRLIQGVAGSTVFPAGMAITVAAFPKSEEGRALGVYGALIGIGLAMGPLLGGLITSVASWRWIFYINIPTIIISLAICISVVKESRLKEKLAIDWWGMIFLTLAVSSLIYVVTEAPDFGWTSSITIGLFCFSIIAFILFFNIEKRVSSPILPLRLFENRGFLIGSILYVVTISSAWVLMFFSPLYLSNVLGYDVAKTGIILLAMTSMTAIVPTFAGYLFDKRGVLFVALLAFIPIVLGYVMQIGFDVTTSLWLLLPAYVVFGLGWGVGNGVCMPIALSELTDTANVGVVSAAAITILNVVGVIGLTVSGTFFRAYQTHKMFALLKAANMRPSRHDVGLIHTLLAQPEKAPQLLSQFSHAAAAQITVFYKMSFTNAYVGVIIGLLVITLLLFVWSTRLLRLKRKI